MIKILVLSVLAVVTLGMVGCSQESDTMSTSNSTYSSAPVDSKGMTHR